MAQLVHSEQLTVADELRALLADGEKRVGSVNGQSAEAVGLLRDLDRIAELWPDLEAAGMDLRPEAGRWETLQAQVHKRAGAIVRELRGSGGLSRLREERLGSLTLRPMEEQAPRIGHGVASEALPWWWHLDQEVQARQRNKIVRLGSIALIAAIAIGGGYLLLKALFPMDPLVAAAASHLSSGQQKVINSQDYAGALVDFQAAADATPMEAEPWLWIGVIQERLGNAAASRDAFARAQALEPQELAFRLARAAAYAQAQMTDQAQKDIDAVLAIDPENPQAYYYQATLEELQGRLADAAQSLDKASTYATARNQTELVAMARVRMAFMMQRMQVGPSTPGTPPAQR